MLLSPRKKGLTSLFKEVRVSRKVHFSRDFLGVFDFLRSVCSLGIPLENL